MFAKFIFRYKFLLFISFTSLLQGQVKLTKNISDFKPQLSSYVSRPDFPVDYDLYEINFSALKLSLLNAPTRSSGQESNVFINLPTLNNGSVSFNIFEASNFDTQLQSRFPNIRSYVGIAKDKSGAVARISLDSRGINVYLSIIGEKSQFLEPITTDATIYCLYEKGNVSINNFECSTVNNTTAFNPLTKTTNTNVAFSNQANLTTFRLAMSCDGQYASFHGGTEASVLAAINTTLTRVNGVYEKDIALHLELINNTTDVFYYNSATDPYGSNFNSELQSTLNSQIGAANYDIGHLVSANGGGGNAGCIGCICNNSNKGSAYTASSSPVGDAFDIDYVAHEIGHQLGANHTFSNNNEGSGVNMEVGSGVTIMGYAGITGQDTHSNSIDIFHSASIQQIQNNIASKSCQTNTAIGFAAPVVNAGQDYVIPKLTPFLLEGSATTTSGGVLSYVWEQFDNGTFAVIGNNSRAFATKLVGPNWVNYNVSSEPIRYFPKKSVILSNGLTTPGLEVTAEALSSVSRPLNFRFTARDNALGAGLTNFDNAVITVDGTKGPLNVTSQSGSGQSWDTNSSQTITWSVNNTNTIVGGENVDILLSTDGGQNFNTVLATNLPNNGSATVTAPSFLAEECRVMVKASNNVFFNVNSSVFSLGYIVINDCEEYIGAANIAVPDGASPNTEGAVVTDNVLVDLDGDVDLLSVYLNMSHEYINDLKIVLKSPMGTEVVVWDRECGQQNNFAMTLQDGGATFTCTNNMFGVFAPSNPLSTFFGEEAAGLWELQLSDFYNGDAGILNEWKLNVCSKVITTPMSSEAFANIGFSLYPNPSKGNFVLKFNDFINTNTSVTVYDVQGRVVYTKDIEIGTNESSISLQNPAAGVYFVKLNNDSFSKTEKLLIE